MEHKEFDYLLCGSLNVEKSIHAYQRCGSQIQIKECYVNVFRVFGEHYSKFKTKEWRVAYGYLRVFPDKPVYCRHCFILDRNNEVIDVTLVALLQDKGKLNLEDETTYSALVEEREVKNKYLLMHIYDDPDEYLKVIEEEDLQPALIMTLLKEEHQILQWAMLHNLMLCG